MKISGQSPLQWERGTLFVSQRICGIVGRLSVVRLFDSPKAPHNDLKVPRSQDRRDRMMDLSKKSSEATTEKGGRRKRRTKEAFCRSRLRRLT
jgi:hypothetical protein